MVNSGTEATMSSIRLARAFTGRNKIIKFEGCYHGHCDSLMVKAGSGLTTFGIATSQGIPQVLTELTFSLPFNELKPVTQVMKDHGNDIACIILEPIMGNSGVILPEIQFLQGLRALADEYKCLLIFDEVMTGFRVSLGGAQELYNIEPDLTCLGKIIGGGLPVGAYGGKKKIMEMLSPIGAVYQAGTLSGNPLAMAAGLAQLKVMTQDNAYDVLKGKTEKLVNGIKEIIKTNNYPLTINHTTGMFSLFFHKNEIHSYEDALKCDTKKFTQFWKKIKELGLFWPPSQFEACFILSFIMLEAFLLPNSFTTYFNIRQTPFNNITNIIKANHGSAALIYAEQPSIQYELKTAVPSIKSQVEMQAYINGNNTNKYLIVPQEVVNLLKWLNGRPYTFITKQDKWILYNIQ